MTRVNKTKTSRYIVYVGWGLTLYADTIQDVNNIIFAYGCEKVRYEVLK